MLNVVLFSTTTHIKAIGSADIWYTSMLSSFFLHVLNQNKPIRPTACGFISFSLPRGSMNPYLTFNCWRTQCEKTQQDCPLIISPSYPHIHWQKLICTWILAGVHFLIQRSIYSNEISCTVSSTHIISCLTPLLMSMSTRIYKVRMQGVRMEQAQR